MAAPQAEPLPPELARYHRQIMLPAIGIAGQRRLLAARVMLIGCGALGTALANTLVRAGVGKLTLVDRDFIEPNNLQRQSLFDEDDIAASLPKAIAAQGKLARINSAVQIDAVVSDVNYSNIEALLARAGGADLILDGTDNFETRFLINDLSIKSAVPWIYGAVLGTTGLAMVIRPGLTPCLRCVFETIPPPGMNPTCDVAGILAPAVAIVAGWQSAEALKLLTGQPTSPYLFSFDLGDNRFQQVNIASARSTADCPVCQHREFDLLHGKFGSASTTLCGRDAVQILPRTAHAEPLDFSCIAANLHAVASATYNAYMLRCVISDASASAEKTYEMTLFPDGRAIIKGTSDPALARTLYAKYIGA